MINNQSIKKMIKKKSNKMMKSIITIRKFKKLKEKQQVFPKIQKIKMNHNLDLDEVQEGRYSKRKLSKRCKNKTVK